MAFQFRRALAGMHAWAGLITGLALFLVCLSGVFTVFRTELDLWAHPGWAKYAGNSAGDFPVNAAFRTIDTAYPGSVVEDIFLPTPTMPVALAYVKPKAAADKMRLKLALHPQTAEIIEVDQSQIGSFFRRLHVFLFWMPRWVIGALGVVMLALLISGLLIHPKIFKEWRTLRSGRSLRLFLTDLHKLIGLWGMVFYLVWAFTGAWLGLKPVVQASQRALVSPRIQMPTQVASKPAQNLLPEVLVQQARAAFPELNILRLSFNQWHTSEAKLRLSGKLPDTWLSADVVVWGQDGRVSKKFDPRSTDAFSKFEAWLKPLHFGNFAGLGLKVLYALMGVAASLLTLTGTLLWFERVRRHLPSEMKSRGAE